VILIDVKGLLDLMQRKILARCQARKRGFLAYDKDFALLQVNGTPEPARKDSAQGPPNH
jgi:hypothetical protein